MQHRQSTCCEVAVWPAFHPRNLLIRTGQCVRTFSFLTGFFLSPLLFFIFYFFNFLPPSFFQTAKKKSFATERLFAALHFSIWVSETFAHNLNTSTSTHTHTQPYQPMQTFLFLMWPTHLELQRHQPADRFNESCSHDQPVWSWCSHITLHKCCCVSDLFSFPLADCWGHMVSFSHPNYRYLVEGEKKHLKHTTVHCFDWQNHANTNFPLWDFFLKFLFIQVLLKPGSPFHTKTFADRFMSVQLHQSADVADI